MCDGVLKEILQFLMMINTVQNISGGRKMNKVDGGAITPEMQAEFLAKYAHLIGIVGNDKYYVYDTPALSKTIEWTLDKAFKVITIDGKAVQVVTMSKKEAETMVKCSNLKFGDF